MTEAEWLACSDPSVMLGYLSGRVSDRKLRLFACACVRRVWKLLWAGDDSRKAVEVAEGYADGNRRADELGAARTAVVSRLELYPAEPVYDAAYWTCGVNVLEDVVRAAHYSANVSTKPVYDAGGDDIRLNAARRCEEQSQAALLREVIGNPFSPVVLDQGVRTQTTVGLARAIYDERAFDRLPILADALEEAGCDNADVLNHCRHDQVHVRGCWVVDLVLGKS